MGCKRAKVGTMLRGQAWVALHGDFTIGELKALVKTLEDNCRGLEPRNGDKRRPNDRLGCESTDH